LRKNLYASLSLLVVGLAGLSAVILLGVGGCGERRSIPKMSKEERDNNVANWDLTNGAALEPKKVKPLDLAFIPPEAAVALVVDPYQMLESQNITLFKSSQLPQLIQTDTAIDPAKVEQLIIVGGLGKKLGEYFVGSIVRFKQPLDQQQFLSALAPDWEDAGDGDRKYHRPVEGGRCVFFADPKTLVTADEATLKKMLSASKDAESPLLTTLRKADDGAAALAVVEVAAIRPQIMTFLLFSKLPAPFDQPPFDQIKEVPKNIDEAVLKFEVTPEGSISLTLVARNEEAAIATDTFVANVVEKLGERIDEMTGRAGGGEGSSSQVAALLDQMFASFKARFKHKQEGNELLITYGGIPFQNQLVLLGPPLMGPMLKPWLDSYQGESLKKLEKIGAALDAEVASQGAYPAPASSSADGKPLLSWRVHLLPYLGCEALYKEFHLDEPWDSAHNKKLIGRMPAVYRTPGHIYDGKTQYLLVTGAGTAFPGKEGPQPDTITDPKGATILAVEVFDGRGVEWTKPEDLKYDRADPLAKLTHLAKLQFLALFADGSVKSIEAKKSEKVVPALITPAGGEEIPADF
jgi:Protein of unknown function (DUF1559)